MAPTTLNGILLSLAALAGAALAHFLLWRLGRRLPLVILRRGSHHPSRADDQATWRRRVELALLPVKVGVWGLALLFGTERFPPLARLRDRTMELLSTSFSRPLFFVDERSFSALDLLSLPLLLAALWLVVSVVSWFFRQKVLLSAGLDAGAREAITTLLRYVLLLLGGIVVLQLWGIDSSTLAIVGSVVGVGIGFGLQNIANNFVSGILIGLERPIKPGDYVEVGSYVGTVVRVGARSTVVRTLDRVNILVPNSRFLETEVINWSHGDPVSRLRLPVTLAYGSPVERARAALLSVAHRHPKVLSDPRPEVQMTGFGDSALHFDLLVWTRDPRNQQRLKSDLNIGIDAALRRHSLEIPYPQRDLHLRSSHLDPLVDAWSQANLSAEDDTKVFVRPLPSHMLDSEPEDPTFADRAWSDEELTALTDRLRGPNGVVIRDRRHLFNLYPNCFVGREAVDWLQAQETLSREEALRLGRLMMNRGHFHHVLDEHGFEDGPLFYRFHDDEKK